MKKTTLILSLLMSCFVFAQNTSTGVVTLTSGFTVQFDVNASTDIVTMTMVGPSDVWLGVALGVNTMLSSGDVIISHGSNGTLSDRRFSGYQIQPPADPIQNWTESSNAISSGVRTIVATRAISTGDSNDFTFLTTNGASLPMAWAKGASLDLTQTKHQSKGVAMGTLGTSEIASLPEFKVHPNPVTKELTVDFPAAVKQATISVYSVLGTLVYSSTMDQWNSKINTSEWNTGIYLMNVNTANFSQTKRIIKQ
jgi:hypothetical protein